MPARPGIVPKEWDAGVAPASRWFESMGSVGAHFGGPRLGDDGLGGALLVESREDGLGIVLGRGSFAIMSAGITLRATMSLKRIGWQ